MNAVLWSYFVVVALCLATPGHMTRHCMASLATALLLAELFIDPLSEVHTANRNSHNMLICLSMLRSVLSLFFAGATLLT